MGFASLFRSKSESHAQPKHVQHNLPVRAKSVPHHPNAHNDAKRQYQKAEVIYQAECDQIMRDELTKRDRNDRECKRQLQGLNNRMELLMQDLERQLDHRDHIATTEYHSGRIDSKQYNKIKAKNKQKIWDQRRVQIKWKEAEMAKAHRVFFARGEEIAASTGAALRRAKEKKDRNQQAAIR